MIFFSFLPVVDSGRLLIGEEKRKREEGRNKRNQEENNEKSARSLYTGD